MTELLVSPSRLLLNSKKFTPSNAEKSLKAKKNKTLPTTNTYPQPNLLREVKEDKEPKTFLDELIEKYSGGGDVVGIVDKMQIPKNLTYFWETKTTIGYLPDARVGATLTAVSGEIYLFGGQCAERLNDIKKLDFRSWHWKGLEPTSHQESTPEPRHGHSAVAFRNYLVVYGGVGAFNRSLHIRECFPLVYIFNTISLKWECIKPLGRMPEARRNHSAAVCGTTMIIYGGIDGNGKILGDLQALNLNTFEWFSPKIDRSSNKPGPLHSFSLSAFYHPSVARQANFDVFSVPNYQDEIFTRKNSGIYLFGGVNRKGEAFNNLYALQPKKKGVREEESILKWTKISPTGTPPTPRYGHTATVCGSQLFIIGGRNDRIASDKSQIGVEDMAVYSIQSNRWESITVKGVPPSPRWGASGVSVGSKVIYFGGMKLSSFCENSLHVMETEDSYAKELFKLWEQEESNRKARESSKRLTRRNGILPNSTVAKSTANILLSNLLLKKQEE